MVMETLSKLLENRCEEIYAEKGNEAAMDEVLKTYQQIKEISDIARHYGLLYLEEEMFKLDRQDEIQDYLATLIGLIVDGTKTELVMEIGTNLLISRGWKSYDGLRALMYLRGCVMIQYGDYPSTIGIYLNSMLPTFLYREVLKREL